MNLSLGDSVEKLVSHSMEVLGVAQADIEGIKMLSGAPLFSLIDLMDMICIFNPGFPPKPLDISDRDRSIESLGVRNGDTIIFQNLKPATNTTTNQTSSNSNSSSNSSSSSACPPAPSLPKAEGPSEAKRQKTENSTSSLRMERQVIF